MDKSLIKRMLYFIIGIIFFIFAIYVFFYVALFILVIGLIYYIYCKFFKRKKNVANSNNKKVGPVVIDMEED